MLTNVPLCFIEIFLLNSVFAQFVISVMSCLNIEMRVQMLEILKAIITNKRQIHTNNLSLWTPTV